MSNSNRPEKGKKRNPFKRELAEWGILLAIIGVLYITGWHTEVIGRLQSVLLFTGILQPDTELQQENIRDAYYDMPLVTLDGDPASLATFRGKTIFLNFWATWCPPCIAEMPNIQSLYEDVDSDDVQFVMVSLDEDRQKARDFLKRKELTLPVYFLAGRKPGVYNSTVVPTTYLISPEGEIVMEHRGMAKYNTTGFKSFLSLISSNKRTVPDLRLSE